MARKKKILKPFAFTMRLTEEERSKLNDMKKEMNISSLFREYLYYEHLNYENRLKYPR